MYINLVMMRIFVFIVIFMSALTTIVSNR